jgi:GMP synthase-like glutamine amidotransferase
MPRRATGCSMSSVAIVDLHGGRPNTAIASLSAHVTANRADLEIFDGVTGRLPPIKHFDAYIISGGPDSPVVPSPWRVRLQTVLPTYAKTRPVFGIGLGFEVMAASYGWPVRALANARDGVFPITPTPAGWNDAVMKDLKNATPVFEQRTWAVLSPPAAIRTSATVLAYSSAGDVAAARFNDHAVGTIFHPEAKTNGSASTVVGRFLMVALEGK